MKIISGLANLKPSLAGSVATIGNFDGVHLGHRRLISQVIEKSKELSVPSVLVTFDPHPSVVLRPEMAAPRIYTTEVIANLCAALGLDILVVEPFTIEFSRLTGEKFMQDYFVKALHPRAIVVGYDFQFGHERSSSIHLLTKMGAESGFSVTQLAPVLLNGEIVSSSAIRKLITSGEVEKAAKFLGQNYFVTGFVETGDGRGQRLGFATANIPTKGQVTPRLGVYCSRIHVAGKSYPAITNVGTKPTFQDSDQVTIETHILDQKLELYGTSIQLEFIKRLRDELKFSTAHELITQINQDIVQAKNYFGL